MRGTRTYAHRDSAKPVQLDSAVAAARTSGTARSSAVALEGRVLVRPWATA
jgi:hypothetical protein